MGPAFYQRGPILLHQGLTGGNELVLDGLELRAELVKIERVDLVERFEALVELHILSIERGEPVDGGGEKDHVVGEIGSALVVEGDDELVDIPRRR